LIDQVSNGTPGGIKQGEAGGGNMPAFGKQINPAEMTALVEFLTNLRPQGVPAPETASARTDGKEYP
jgi:ubiquinol-cytochrome c reductase cytochrome b subunit